ncbi:FMN-dependent NADH-azoreductase [Streptomyces physcomitrii]|uniref:FMN dependent NADH:quinone oxidoreductase n=1 Tax=Streptomyces physcomitrii TaxID=2724184 RepID=A0ABX1H1Z6_9ACTN|nr:NAD(P)H-dependent oxidoreductase [Streptomyces physcomitrii]NKI41071.1 FMN-dependent NADH-azoreductase [Streptomyces physcomitrii]
MATLLHLDSSFSGEQSVSRAVTSVFRENWEKQHPEGTVVYRDLAAEPLPHLDGLGASAGFADPAQHTPEQADAFARRLTLIEELEQADAVLIGAPMYNFTIPSTLKAWLDHVILVGRTGGEDPSGKGKPLTIVASRGGSTAPGTPRERYEYVQNYLQAVLGDMMGFEVDFIVPELTLAASTPAMADLVPAAEASRAKALDEAEQKAVLLAQRLAA